MISIGRIGIESDIELKTVDNMEITIKPNQHIQMVLGGVLNKSADSFQPDWEGKDIQILELDMDGHPKEVIFHGIIKKTYTYVENRVSQIIITALSASIMLDKEEKSHSYQNIKKTYDQLVQETVASAGGSVRSYSPDTMQILKPVVQYMETDWEFCKRMVSHMRTPLYCDPTSPGISLQVGINAGKKPVMEIGQEYQAVMKPALSVSQMVLSYEVKDYENYRIGDLVKTPSGNMHVCEKTVVFENGELHFLYKLCYLKDIQMDVVFNSRIAGLMLEGEVINTEKEKVFVKFDIDGSKGEALYPYPWTPITGNIMYCMPEQGAKVGVYFGCSDEKEASAIVVLQRNPSYTIIEKRILETRFGKKLQLYPERLSVKSELMSEKNLALELIDKNKFSMQSHNYLHMYSSGNIRLKAPFITVKTPTELHVSRTSLSNMEEKMRASGSQNPATGGGNVDSVFTMGHEFNLLSDQGVLCGTEHIKYEDCNDALTEVKSKFDCGILWRNIIAGLAVVAVASALLAYGASLVFTGGAMAAAAPFIVGGIASIVGFSAVRAKAQSDIENQKNSSPWEYMGVGLLGATAGAVAGFAIVMSPYAAQWLTQQALLMIPNAFLNSITFSLISGGSMFVTGGITFSNLIFTQYNVVETVSGKNSLKDWMIACDEKNGESTYNTLSTVSFVGAMGVMFVGAGYMNSMRQTGSGGGSNSIGGKGAYNGNVYDGNRLGTLEGKEISVSQKGIDIVKEHLSGEFSSPANDAMIERLEHALASGETITGADASFYMHELAEATLMSGGIDYVTAHRLALQKYDVSPFSVYHPDVIKKFSDMFNSLWKKFWGIE